MRKFLVCDGGGTKTDFLVFNEIGETLAYCQKGGANAKFLDEDIAMNNVITGIDECLKISKTSLDEITKIKLFIPGFEACINEVKSKLEVNDIECLSDIDNAFYGALGKAHGIVVLSGTGSFAVGVSKENKKVITGGWGPLVGDKGSGYHIGLMCLEHLAYFYDNEIKDSKMRELALNKFNISNEFAMRDIIYSKTFNREQVAEFCKVVSKSASEGDFYALGILKEAARELVKLVEAVNERLGNESLPVTLIGGVSKIGNLFIDILKEELTKNCSNLNYVNPKYNPLVGAMLYVLYNEIEVDVESNEINENLKKYEEEYSLC